MSQIIAANAFKVVEGRPVTSSRIVAEYFGKQHHHVVRDIRTLISQKPDLERNANFGECSETINLANGATRQVRAGRCRWSSSCAIRDLPRPGRARVLRHE